MSLEEPMNTDQKDSLNVVTVLIDQVRMEIDSSTLPSKVVDRLLRDVSAIPERYRAIQRADAAVRRTWKKRKAS